MSSLIYSIILLIIFPVLLLSWEWQIAEKSWLIWFLKTIAVGVSLLSLFYLLNWSLLSYYLRFLYILFFVFIVFQSAYRSWHKPIWNAMDLRQWVILIISILLIFTSLPLLILSNKAFNIPEKPVNLQFPLKDGNYYIANGGNHLLMNEHQRLSENEPAVWQGQKWAIDILKLNRWGNQSDFMIPDEPENFKIWGEPIYSPCTGTVVQTRNDHTDFSFHPTDTLKPGGNYVIIQCGDSVFVVLANLKKGSLVIKPGDKIEMGDFIGKVGNSANSYSPHLHVSAQKTLGYPTLFNAPPLPMTFSGKFLMRNEVVHQSADDNDTDQKP